MNLVATEVYIYEKDGTEKMEFQFSESCSTLDKTVYDDKYVIVCKEIL